MEGVYSRTKKAVLPVIRGDGRNAGGGGKRKPTKPKPRNYPPNITNPNGTRAAVYDFLNGFGESIAHGVDLLIAAGHSFNDIKNYKLRQANAFIALFKKRHSIILREEAIAVRMAHHADGKDFMKFIDSE